MNAWLGLRALPSLSQLNAVPCTTSILARSLTHVQSSCISAASSPQTADIAPPGAPAREPQSAYVHLPFCKRKCFYCDFPVQAIGVKPGLSDGQLAHMEEYVAQLCREIQATARLGSAPLQTVYFGGGTPSLLPPELLEQVLGVVRRHLGIAAGAEVTLEADPGTFDLPRLQRYRSLGISRLSVGVQSFQQELLEACGRAHSLEEVHSALQAVHAAGFESWSLDLISGLPHLTPDLWQQSLDAAVQAQPPHVSVYDLQVEVGTPFARWYKPGQRPLPDDQAAWEMYAAAARTLGAAGYEHYEVSNYAQPGKRSRHNQVYWRGEPYYAFGLGAASYLAGRRFSRPAAMRGYYAWVEQFCAAGSGIPALEQPPEGPEDLMLDCVMLSLRTADGLNLQDFQRRFGAQPRQAVERALAGGVGQGLVLCFGSDEQQLKAEHGLEGAARVRLTDPEGFLVSNDIISDVFAGLGDITAAAGAAGA